MLRLSRAKFLTSEEIGGSINKHRCFLFANVFKKCYIDNHEGKVYDRSETRGETWLLLTLVLQFPYLKMCWFNYEIMFFKKCLITNMSEVSLCNPLLNYNKTNLNKDLKVGRPLDMY